MRKLLNTLYVTSEESYLACEGENIVQRLEGKNAFRFPLCNLDGIVCFNYPGVSPALMGKCAENNISLCFLTPSGRFLARVVGEVKGNVLLRKRQIECFDGDKRIKLIRNCVAAKLANTGFLLKRTMRDYPETDCDGALFATVQKLKEEITRVYEETDINVIRGIEGDAAKTYFSVFDRLILKQKEVFWLAGRQKRPPTDPVNAMLSFLYTIVTNDIAAALETVGLDPYIGFFHTLRPGRASLACDLAEEFRSIAERLVLTLINLKVVDSRGFEQKAGGAVLFDDAGRKKILKAWQDKKKESVYHSVLKEKVPIGLLPYVQSNLLAKFVRGEIEEYPVFLLKQ